jgi:hypothetical protein
MKADGGRDWLLLGADDLPEIAIKHLQLLTPRVKALGARAIAKLMLRYLIGVRTLAEHEFKEMAPDFFKSLGAKTLDP